MTTFYVKMDVSSLNEQHLRKLFDIIKESDPNVLAAGLATLLRSGQFQNNNVNDCQLYEKSIEDSLDSNTTDDNKLAEDNEVVVKRCEEEREEEAQPAGCPEVETLKKRDVIRLSKLKENVSSSEEFPAGTDSFLKQDEGAYLHYDGSCAKLMIQYSKVLVPNALGFYASNTIPEFKYKRNLGRAELIGNCASGVAGRKNYYSGWCQFIRAARSAFKTENNEKSERGELWIYPLPVGQQGLHVDIYLYQNDRSCQTVVLSEGKNLRNEICDIDGIACLPKHADFFADVKSVDFNRWLTEANSIGAVTRFTDGPSSCEEQSTFNVLNSTPTGTLLNINNQKDNAKNMTTFFPFERQSQTDLKSLSAEEEIGCYLLYDSSSCKLMLNYSKVCVPNAVGFYGAGNGQVMKEFNFKRNFGRAELIGNCASGIAGRKNYYSGWCQFIRAARAIKGSIWIHPCAAGQQGLDVDIYVYYRFPDQQTELDLKGKQTIKLIENIANDVSNIDAVAVLPKFTDFCDDLKVVDLNRWLTLANAIGATSRFAS